MGAARYLEGRRELNTRDVQAYVRKAAGREIDHVPVGMLAGEERARETVALQLRRREGIDRREFRVRRAGFGRTIGGERCADTEMGLLEDENGRVRLTRRGKSVADALVRELL